MGMGQDGEKAKGNNMSECEPTEPYVYQPYGSFTDKDHDKAGRLWGVGMPSDCALLTTIKGLTHAEALQIVESLKNPDIIDLELPAGFDVICPECKRSVIAGTGTVTHRKSNRKYRCWRHSPACWFNQVQTRKDRKQ